MLQSPVVNSKTRRSQPDGAHVLHITHIAKTTLALTLTVVVNLSMTNILKRLIIEVIRSGNLISIIEMQKQVQKFLTKCQNA